MTVALDYMERIVNARSVDDLWQYHTEHMAIYGFDRLIYGFTRHMTSKTLGDPRDWLILSNHSDEYMAQFLDGGLVTDAPMVHWALNNDGVCSWALLGQKKQNQTLTPRQLAVLDYNEKMHVTAGYSISFRSVSERAKGAIALTSKAGMSQDDTDEMWRTSGREIQMANNLMHLKFLTLPFSGRRPLTKRQSEVLQWVADGKTTQDIAQILGLTSATIEKHLRLARVALDVETTAQAVLKASDSNQLFQRR